MEHNMVTTVYGLVFRVWNWGLGFLLQRRSLYEFPSFWEHSYVRVVHRWERARLAVSRD